MLSAGFLPTLFRMLSASREEDSPLKAPPLSRLRIKREGRSHSLWQNPRTGAMEAVPRHTDIANQLARKICRSMSIPEIG